MFKCNHCGKPIIKYPVKGQQEKTLQQNFQEKTIIWKNMFKTDFLSIAMILIIIFLTVAYKAEIAKCNQAMEYPCDFCDTTGCCTYGEFMPDSSMGNKYELRYGYTEVDNATEQLPGLP